jgi:hypothetical protein
VPAGISRLNDGDSRTPSSCEHEHEHASRFPIYNDARAIDHGVRAPERGDDAITASLHRAEIDEEHLILAVVDDLAEHMPAAHQIGWRELALEDRVLQMVAEVAHRLVDRLQAFVLADVVTDEVGVARQGLFLTVDALGVAVSGR